MLFEGLRCLVRIDSDIDAVGETLDEFDVQLGVTVRVLNAKRVEYVEVEMDASKFIVYFVDCLPTSVASDVMVQTMYCRIPIFQSYIYIGRKRDRIYIYIYIYIHRCVSKIGCRGWVVGDSKISL